MPRAGIGLRPEHLATIRRTQPEIGWLELLADNWMQPGGSNLGILHELRETYPISLHSVGLSLGSVLPLDRHYLTKLKNLADQLDPFAMSEHLCWTTAHGVHFHDLLPLPYTEEAVQHTAARIRQAQEILERPLLIENVSSYLTFPHSTLEEGAFVAAVASEANCGILLDLHNLHVTEANHGIPARSTIELLPFERIGEIHLAGGETNEEGWLIDTHGTRVAPAVWELYAWTLALLGPRPTLLEWDHNIPDFNILFEESIIIEHYLHASHLTESVAG